MVSCSVPTDRHDVFVLSAFGISVLQCLGCLLPFLDNEMIDSLPYLVAAALAVLPPSLHQEVINSLCFYILPFTISKYRVICTDATPCRGSDSLILFYYLFRTARRSEEEESYASQSVTSVIMLVFQHCSSMSHHCQLIECLMALKPGVVKDILCVIAHGTSTARASAAKLLFYYWPTFNSNICDIKIHQQKISCE